MRAKTFAACGLMAIAGFTASAQTPAPQQPASATATARPSTDTRGSDSKNVTLTGCVTAASAASASADGAKYTLTNVQQGASSASASTPSSSDATRASGNSGKTYQLKADSTVDLSAHVNHKVQIVGTLDKGAHPTSADSPTSPSAAGKTERAHESMKSPTLNVSSVTMVSSSCSSRPTLKPRARRRARA